MVRVSAVFVAACMVLICVSFGTVLYLTFGLSATEALVAALAALTGLVVCALVANNGGRRGASPTQIVELSRGVAELARQVVELGRRVAAMEGRVTDAVERAAVAEPLAAEIGEIGVLIKQLAESVSAHELELQYRKTLPLDRAVSGESASGGAAATHRSPTTSAENKNSAAHKSLAELNSIMARPPESVPAGGAANAAGASGPAMSAPTAGAHAGGAEKARLGFRGLAMEAAIAVVREAIEANRLDFFLQPILTLPQRKVRFYEGLARLRTAEGETLDASDFVEAAEAGGLMPRIDTWTLFRCVQVARRLVVKNRDVGLFCNLSASTLVDAEFFPQLTEFMEANRTIAPALVLEIAQPTYRTMGPLENESLLALAGWGFRFSMNRVGDLKFEPRNLADRGFRFIKVPAGLLLNRHNASAADIHAADLTGLLMRFGIELIVDEIESEGAVVDLLDYEVKFGQGHLFSPPRAVRADLLQAPIVDAPAASAKADDRPPPREAERAGSVVTPNPKVVDPRRANGQRSTGLAKIARPVAVRAIQ